MNDDGVAVVKTVENINAYLVGGKNTEVVSQARPMSELAAMQFGNHPYYGSALIFPLSDAKLMVGANSKIAQFVRPLYGSREFIASAPRACLWVKQAEFESAASIPQIKQRFDAVTDSRLEAKQDKSAQKLADTPYRFREQLEAQKSVLVVPRVSSENRQFLPVGLLPSGVVIQEKAFALYDAPLWNMALIASRLHWVWIGTVCVRLEMRFSYSNTLGWNTFPVPTLTENNKAELTRCAEDILLAREAHFPATIADLYDPATMPENLRAAHERNDETLERIYIGRKFRNDTERLEKLFELYTVMAAAAKGKVNGKGKKR